MGGFIRLLQNIAIGAGTGPGTIFQHRKLELPGYFRATKEWDLLVVRDGQLVAALEVKSQVGPSFGNNFNNRTEEAIGSAVDLWTAWREGAFNKTVKPWLGYVFLLEDCPQSRSPVALQEPHFRVFPEFVGASYAKRYELLCRKLIRERQYDAASFLLAARSSRRKGTVTEPAQDLTFANLARSLAAQIGMLGG